MSATGDPASFRSQLAGAQAAIRELTDLLYRQKAEAAAILADLVSDEECYLDHHGYCQTHGWMSESPCPHVRAHRWLFMNATKAAK